MTFHLKSKSFHPRNCIWKYCLQNVGHFFSASICWIHAPMFTCQCHWSMLIFGIKCLPEFDPISSLLNPLSPSDAYMRRKTNHHWFIWWLVTWSVPSHYLKQWLNNGMLIRTLGKKLQWNPKRNLFIFIQENALMKCPLRNVVYLVSASELTYWGLKKDGRHFANGPLKCNFLNTISWNLI